MLFFLYLYSFYDPFTLLTISLISTDCVDADICFNVVAGGWWMIRFLLMTLFFALPLFSNLSFPTRYVDFFPSLHLI